MTGLYRFFANKGQLIALLIGLISLFIVFGILIGGLSGAGYDTGTDLNAVLKGGGGDGFNMFNAAIVIPLILVAICAILWLIFGVGRILTNPKASLLAIISFAVILVLFFVLYSSSDVETTGKLGLIHEKFGISGGVSKFISGGIKTTVGLVILAFISMVVFEIYNMFK